MSKDTTLKAVPEFHPDKPRSPEEDMGTPSTPVDLGWATRKYEVGKTIYDQGRDGGKPNIQSNLWRRPKGVGAVVLLVASFGAGTTVSKESDPAKPAQAAQEQTTGSPSEATCVVSTGEESPEMKKVSEADGIPQCPPSPEIAQMQAEQDSKFSPEQ